MSHFIVETYEVDPKDYDLTEEEMVFYKSYLLKNKAGEGQSKEDEEKAAELKQKRKFQSYVLNGYNWSARVVNTDTNEVFFDVPRLCQSRWHADRYGRRFIKRYEETGDFNTPLGPQIVLSEPEEK